MGQGSLKKHTINTKTMKYIAEKLYDAGYRGKQILYITSCYAKALTRGMSTLKLMVSYLKKLFGLKVTLLQKQVCLVCYVNNWEKRECHMIRYKVILMDCQ